MQHAGEPSSAKGVVFDIQKFSIHDGPGIRTTVFLKGCPLHCDWCHNPESLRSTPQLSFAPALCIGCGFCFKTCPNSAHVMQDGAHQLRRDRCRQCFACTAECYARALEIVGQEMTVQEVMTEVLKDRPFYEQSGGGVTLSGGEPMLQFDFARAILAAAKAQKLHTCLETSGFAPAQAFHEVLPLVDLFFYDCKETDPERHRTFTGQTNDLVLRNLRALDAAGARIILRCPLIPGYNLRDDHLAGIARLSQELAHCEAVHVLGYHRLGASKRERLGLGKDGSQGLGIPESELNAAIEKLRSLGARNVCRS